MNKVESAVRVRHLPTGLAVKCTEERSQQMNRAKALSILKSKLLVMENERREEELARIRGEAVVAARRRVSTARARRGVAARAGPSRGGVCGLDGATTGRER